MSTVERDQRTTTLLNQAVRRLVDEFHPDRIYLFGSQPRGDALQDSDYDIMVVVPESDVPQFRRAQDAYRALWGIRLDIDVLVWTSEEFNRQAQVVASLPAAIVREGELLYAT